MRRREALGLLAAALPLAAAGAADSTWHDVDVTGTSPSLEFALQATPDGKRVTQADYREAILQQNVLGKTTGSTRQKSLRHLHELYSLNEGTPIFGLLRKLYAIDSRQLQINNDCCIMSQFQGVESVFTGRAENSFTIEFLAQLLIYELLSSIIFDYE